MKIFLLPDLGEGLADAEIIEWYVAEGDTISLDEPLISMETAKAVVEVPSPFAGKVSKQYGQPGDVIETGKPLAGFEVEGEMDEDPNFPPEDQPDSRESVVAANEDAGSVVGSMKTSTGLLSENMTTVGGIKVTPAVRALAHKLKVDLAGITPSGKDGVVTRADVEAAFNSARLTNPARSVTAGTGESHFSGQTSSLNGTWEPVRGTRRTMARAMSEAHALVVPTSIMDDADIHQWADNEDTTVRLLRSMWAGARLEPGLNAWYDAGHNRRLIHKRMDVGMAVDTPDGLFAAVLRNVHAGTAVEVRDSINRLRNNVENRSIPPSDLKDYTIMLSNFGMFAGRYATPVINPPCVAIIAAGKARKEVVEVLNGFESHRVIPISLTFDHRACTGGEAARFLRAMLDDLALPE